MLLAILAPCAQAALKYDVGGYVQDGLVLHLDGIRNVGANVPHDGSATVWANLAGGGGAMKTAYAGTGKNSSGTGRWLDNAFYMDADWYFKTIGVIPASESVTVEVFGDFTPTQPTSYPNFISVADGGNNTDCGIWMNGGALKWKLDSYGFSNSKRPTISSWDKQGFAVALDASQVVLYASGATVSNTQTGRTSGKTFPACQWNIGCNWQAGNHPGKGTYYAVRIYTNTPTKAQIAANWQLDQYRFVTGIPVTNAVVATSLEGATGAEGVGAFAVDKDGYVFRAPACATVGGVAYALSGCTVASWDDATGNWGAAETRDGVFAVSVSSSDKVKITWQWEAATGSLDAGYLTEDLALRLDGIDNAGIGVHDASANVWKDLSGNGRDATLAGNPSGESHWVDDGYFFASNAVFATGAAATFSLGHAYTMQVLGKVNFADNKDGSHNGTYVSPIDHIAYGSIWLKGDGMGTVQHHTSDMTGAAWNLRGAVFVGLDGHPTYLTAIRNGNRAALVEGTAYPTTENTMEHQACMDWSVGSKDASAPATRWGVGALTGGGGGDPLYGTIKSVRLYDRMLTEDELAWNRNVDSARYFGELGVTNVLVRTKYGDVASAAQEVLAEAPGAYTVVGSWTFSAASVKNKDGILKPVGGYYTEELDALGNWTNKTWHEGETEYPYNCETSPACVRLTWSVPPPGMILILR